MKPHPYFSSDLYFMQGLMAGEKSKGSSVPVLITAYQALDLQTYSLGFIQGLLKDVPHVLMDAETAAGGIALTGTTELANEALASETILSEFAAKHTDFIKIKKSQPPYYDKESLDIFWDQIGFRPFQWPYRIILLEDFHLAATGAAQKLLKILEEPPAHWRILITTTEIDKLPKTILSRCKKIQVIPRKTEITLSDHSVAYHLFQGSQFAECIDAIFGSFETKNPVLKQDFRSQLSQLQKIVFRWISENPHDPRMSRMIHVFEKLQNFLDHMIVPVQPKIMVQSLFRELC